MNLEDMATHVALHNDYRVLRRLVPLDVYLPHHDGDKCVGVILDTESTGVDPQVDRLVELAMVSFEYDRDTGAICRVIAALDALEDPGLPIPARATAIHGITDEMVAGKRIDDYMVSALVLPADIVIAHNASFDRPMVEKRFPIFRDVSWGCSIEDVGWKARGFASSALEFLAYRCGFFYEAHQEHPYLLDLLQSATKTWHRIWATGAPFESKDKLRERGYRWEPEQKCWQTAIDDDDFVAECQWLRHDVYGERTGSYAIVKVDTIDAYSRFTNRFASSKHQRLAEVKDHDR